MGSRGTSLLEALIVMVLTTILVGGAVTGAGRAHNTLMLRMESDRLRLLFERAYSLALTSDSATRVLVEDARASLSRGGDMIASYRATRGVTFEPPRHLDGIVRFYPSHAASPITITVRAGSNTCTVTVSLRGRIRTTC